VSLEINFTSNCQSQKNSIKHSEQSSWYDFLEEVRRPQKESLFQIPPLTYLFIYFRKGGKGSCLLSLFYKPCYSTIVNFSRYRTRGVCIAFRSDMRLLIMPHLLWTRMTKDVVWTWLLWGTNLRNEQLTYRTRKCLHNYYFIQSTPVLWIKGTASREGKRRKEIIKIWLHCGEYGNNKMDMWIGRMRFRHLLFSQSFSFPEPPLQLYTALIGWIMCSKWNRLNCGPGVKQEPKFAGKEKANLLFFFLS